MKTIIIEELQIWPKDLGEMTWDEAIVEVAKLGPGWRLPTIEEFKEVLYPNRSGILGVDDKLYWSSTERSNDYSWNFTFYYGSANYNSKHYTYNVRAVRDVSIEYIVSDLLKEF